jgi:hypothetical protein
MRKTIVGLAVGALVLSGCGSGSSTQAAPKPTPTSSASAADLQSWKNMFASSTPSKIAERCADVKAQTARGYAQGLYNVETEPPADRADVNALADALTAHCAQYGPKALASASASAQASASAAAKAKAKADAASAAAARAAAAKAKATKAKAAKRVKAGRHAAASLERALKDPSVTKNTTHPGVTIKVAHCTAISTVHGLSGVFSCDLTFSDGSSQTSTIKVKSNGDFSNS